MFISCNDADAKERVLRWPYRRRTCTPQAPGDAWCFSPRAANPRGASHGRLFPAATLQQSVSLKGPRRQIRGVKKPD
jgi:hypothetical protein